MNDPAETDRADVHTIAIERDWHDGLKAINELFEHAEGARLRWCRIGKGLLAGRLKCPADRDFNDWLDSTNYRMVSRNERSDAMWLAVNATIALPALLETRITNPERARRHLRENLPAIYVLCTEVRSVTDTSVTDSVSPPQPELPQESAPAPQIASEPDRQEAPSSPLAHLPAKPAIGRSPLKGLFKADLVNAHMLATHTKSALAKLVRTPRGKAVWPLMTEAIETGLYGQPTNVPDTFTITPRVLLPWLPPRSFETLNLKDAYAQDMVRDVLFPLLRERPELRETPHLVEREFQARRRDIEEAARRQAKLDEHKAKVDAGSIGANEHPIVAYGEPLWPPQRPDLTLPYTYKELCHACWFVSYFFGIARVGWKPTEVAMAGRHLAKYIEPVQPGFVAAVRVVFNAYEDHPDGETQFPPIPVNFGNRSCCPRNGIRLSASKSAATARRSCACRMVRYGLAATASPRIASRTRKRSANVYSIPAQPRRYVARGLACIRR
jgi:hypothetical protein